MPTAKRPVPTAAPSRPPQAGAPAENTYVKVEHIENDYLAAWPDEPDLEPDEDDYFNDKPSDAHDMDTQPDEPQRKIPESPAQPIHPPPAHLVPMPVSAASSSAGPPPYPDIDIRLCNVKTSKAWKDLHSGWYIYDVGNTLGKLDEFDKHVHLMGPRNNKSCCGLNGRMQLHLATKSKFHAVVIDLKEKL